MAYNAKTIILLNLGRYAKDKKKRYKSHLPSITQVPLINFKGFSYIDGYLSDPNRTIDPESKMPFKIGSSDLKYIHEVSDAYRNLNILVKCQGRGGDCNNEADYFVIPYSWVRNVEEKIIKGRPKNVKQTDIDTSSFNCGECSEEKRHDNKGRVVKMNIGLEMPDYFRRPPDMHEWSVNKGEIHRKMRYLTFQFLMAEDDGIVNPSLITEKLPIMNRYRAKKLVNKLLDVPTEELPQENKDFTIRDLNWEKVEPNQPLLPFHATS